jgi:hypothetical protein
MWSARRPAVLILLAFAVRPATSSTLVTDLQLKTQLVRAAFPLAKVGKPIGRRLDWTPIRWPGLQPIDALQGEPEFEVTGEPALDERSFLPISDESAPYTRRLRFRAFQLRGSANERRFAALAHYRFEGDNHAMCCEWAVRLFLVIERKGIWHEAHSPEFLFNRGTGVRTFKVEDTNGDGLEEAVVEGDESGGPGDMSNWYTLRILDIDGATPVTLLEIPTLGFLPPTMEFERSLDRMATEATHGSKYCFVTKTFGPDTATTRQCFEKGFQGAPAWR